MRKMFFKYKYLVLLPIVLMMSFNQSNAADLVIDGTSKKALEQSVKAMKDSMGDIHQEKRFGRLFLAMFTSRALTLLAGTRAPLGKDQTFLFLNGVSLKEILNFNLDNDPIIAAKLTSEMFPCGLNASDIALQIVDFKVTKKNDGYSDYSVVKLEVKNTTQHDFRMIDARAIFKDAFGDKIDTIILNKDTIAKSGATVSVGGLFDPYGDLLRVPKMHKDDVKITICLEKMITTDGEKIQF